MGQKWAPLNMSALNQLMVIVNLLYNRKSVSLKSIMEKCEISKRTAFRYVDKISRAGIPIFYDRDRGGYTLCQHSRFPLKQLDINETIIMVVALVHLLNSVEGYYKDSIEYLIKKVESTGELFIEDVVRLAKSNWSKDSNGEEPSKLITSSLLQAAIRLKTKANITLKDKEKRSEIYVENPKLKFDKIWRISEDIERTKEPISLSNIIGIRLKW